MRIHHMNCVSAAPLGRGRRSNHCLLIESERHLVLVDTGYGLRDVRLPRARLSLAMLVYHRPEFREELTAVRQIERMGFDPRDVQHIVLTHLDFDHAGGLDDFPWAAVHMLRAERTVAEARASLIDRMRYRPAQWGTRDRWRTYAPDTGERWLGLPRVGALDGVTSEIVLLPLAGHSLGHGGVAARRADGGWLLLAGDAYYSFTEMDRDRPSCAPQLRAYQAVLEQDRAQRLATQRRLRELAQAQGAALQVICSHDALEFEACAGRGCDTLPPLVRMTRDGRSVVDEGLLDAAPPREPRRPVVVRPARGPAHA